MYVNWLTVANWALFSILTSSPAFLAGELAGNSWSCSEPRDIVVSKPPFALMRDYVGMGHII